MRRHLCFPALMATIALTASPVLAQTLITDSFEADSSASYSIVDDANGASGDGGADSTSQFAFDYVAAGIPLAPNSAPGDTGGLRLTVNASEEGDEGPSATEEDHITAFNNTSITGSYRLDVDMYMGVEAGAGTTEFAHIGVGGASTDFTSIFTPVVDNGYFISITGEGGSGSDYRHSRPGSPAVPSGNGTYLNALNTTNAAVDTYLGIYPATEFPGSPGNSWTTVSITVTPNQVTYWLDGTPIIQTSTAGLSDGLVSLGYTDPFDSVGPHFVIYDNLSVTTIPEPSALLLCLGTLAGLATRRRS